MIAALAAAQAAWSVVRSYWPVIVGSLIGALLACGPVFLYGKSVGKTEAAADAAKAALSRINEMEKSNAKFKNLPARDRCIIFMRDSGLPISNCD